MGGWKYVLEEMFRSMFKSSKPEDESYNYNEYNFSASSSGQFPESRVGHNLIKTSHFGLSVPNISHSGHCLVVGLCVSFPLLQEK